MQRFNKIYIPTRPQPDTIVAIFLLKNYGENEYPGISTADIIVKPTLESHETVESLLEAGIIVIDIGNGDFDHHNKKPKTTASALVAEKLDIMKDPAIEKLLNYVRRDDFYGKGTISADLLDRAFGLSGLIASLNKTLSDKPHKVIEIILPLIEAHYLEESKRTKEFPELIDKLNKERKVTTNIARQYNKKLKIIFVENDDPSFSGFLRSRVGGAYDVVVQRTQSGHVNILTRPAKRINLRKLISALRLVESQKRGIEIKEDSNLYAPGRTKETPEWYFDPATNSIQNGGITRKGIEPTAIPWFELVEIIRIGLSI